MRNSVRSDDPLRIAVLMTSHNRRETTLACLEALMSQESIDQVNLQAYLVDAGSTDGTVGAVEKRFPEVRVICRDNNLYWCGGTRVAFAEAMKEDYDHYLWLNDDTVLVRGAMRILLETARRTNHQDGKAGIIVGSTFDPETGRCTYGGVVRASKWRRLLWRLVTPSGTPERCDTMNGNCVLISREPVRSLGNLAAEFAHMNGDRDYGLRAKAKGIPLWIAPTYVGACRRNPRPLWANPEAPLKERLKLLHSPKGFPPNEWTVFIRRHAGIQWPLYWFALHVHVLLPGLWKWLHK